MYVAIIVALVFVEFLLSFCSDVVVVVVVVVVVDF